jgi:2-methylcitrate dehydratase PrpD
MPPRCRRHGNTLAVVRAGQLANSKASANAMVASQAVLCSLFAAEGMTGPLGVIEHRRGLSTGMLAGAKLDLLAQPIGERYRIMTSAIKAYPCISTAQTLVAGLSLLCVYDASTRSSNTSIKPASIRSPNVNLLARGNLSN